MVLSFTSRPSLQLRLEARVSHKELPVSEGATSAVLLLDRGFRPGCFVSVVVEIHEGAQQWVASLFFSMFLCIHSLLSLIFLVPFRSLCFDFSKVKFVCLFLYFSCVDVFFPVFFCCLFPWFQFQIFSPSLFSPYFRTFCFAVLIIVYLLFFIYPFVISFLLYHACFAKTVCKYTNGVSEGLPLPWFSWCMLFFSCHLQLCF